MKYEVTINVPATVTYTIDAADEAEAHDKGRDAFRNDPSPAYQGIDDLAEVGHVEEAVLDGQVYGVTWYGFSEGKSPTGVAQTGYEFDAHAARMIGRTGAKAPDFWAWAASQSFAVDGMGTDRSFTLISAVAETEGQTNEFTVWMKAEEP